MDNTTTQIQRQSTLKMGIDFLNANYDNFTLQEVVGVSMALQSYVATGDTELINQVQSKLTAQKEINSPAS